MSKSDQAVSDRNKIKDRIRTEYTDIYNRLAWIGEDQAVKAQIRRAELLAEINQHPQTQWHFSETKLAVRDLSPGCRFCGQGEWSCLFINNLCNAACFYCPAPQKDLSQPATGRLEFSDPAAYADYVETFGIRAVSFSGGEPLISFDRVMSFLTTLREKISRPLYIWMYTNGILASTEKFKVLAQAGLDEIRFDLSATDYDLTGLKKAVGIIPRVTVEIPAIPQDMDRLKPLMKQLASLGVAFLNLHQIRCTRFNCQKLADQGYTFVHGQGITVLETELAALELIRYNLAHQIDLPVNYCAFTYRHQFQRAGAQKRNALLVKAPWESTTSCGQIRTTTLSGDPVRLSLELEALQESGISPDLYKVFDKGEQMHLPPHLLKTVNTQGLNLKIVHSGTTLSPSVSYRHSFTKVPINPSTTVVVERFPRHKGIVLSGEQISWYLDRYIHPANTATGAEIPETFSQNPCSRQQSLSTPLTEVDQELLDRHESFVPGLAPYF